MSRQKIYAEIDRVREIQDDLYSAVNDEYTVTDPRLLSVLMEQVGDVSAMLNFIEIQRCDDEAIQALREALLHVAACAVLWLEK